MFRFTLCLLMLVGVVSCGGKRQKGAQTIAGGADSLTKPVFHPTVPPASIPQEQMGLYMQEHFWDTFDFADTTFFRRADTTEMLNTYATYVQHFVSPFDNTPIAALMQRASVTKPTLQYFSMMGERVLHSVDSPLFNEELYIPVLEAQVNSPLYDEYEKMAPQYDLDLALQNRVGHKANDFTYTLASGAKGTLYGVKADYTMIFINNPGCPMCKQITEALKASDLITRMVAEGRLKIVALYPDSDLGEWRKYRGEFPSTWINGYDAGTVISSERLYDLRAIPSIHLLDKDKMVLAKDAYDVGLVEHILRQQGEQ